MADMAMSVILPRICHTLDFAVTVITNGSKPIHQARATELGGATELRKRWNTELEEVQVEFQVEVEEDDVNY